MSVYKRKGSDNWWYKFTWNGEPIRESTKQTNKRTAEQIEAAHRTRLAKGEVGIQERKTVPTLRVFAPQFTASIETLCADKPATVSFYKSKLEQLLKHESLAAKKLDVIDEETIDGYKQARTKQDSNRKKPMAIASVNRELATLRRMLRLAHEWKIIDRVPRIRLLRGEVQREFVLSHEFEPIYLCALGAELYDIAVLLIDTGLRMKECLTLEWQAVHIEPIGAAAYGYLVVRSANSKNSKSRNVPLTARVVAMLKGRQPAKEGLVFRKPDGSALSQTWLNQQHAAVRELLNAPADFVPHSLRHTFGTRLGESGADAFTIMKLMGHSTITVSQRYVHPSPETVERAFGRLESLNLSRKLEVGTILGTVTDPKTATTH
jgi:integrase